MGQPLTSSLVDLFLLAAEIAIILAGIFIILGSVLPERWWSKHFVKYGATKPFWYVVGLLVSLVLISFFVNSILPGLLSNFLSQGGGVGGVTMQFNLPYIVGTAPSTIQLGTMIKVTAPVTFTLTPTFWIAVAAAVIGIAARIYHRRYAVS